MIILFQSSSSSSLPAFLISEADSAEVTKGVVAMVGEKVASVKMTGVECI